MLSATDNLNWIRSNSDKLLLAAFLTLLGLIGFKRLDYAGDGIRHLDHILESNHPALGEPRWILFPLLLFAVVKPFAATGIIHTVPQAIKIFCGFNVLCGFIYLLCLRRWLSALTAERRTAVLILAGGCCVFLTLATDIIEPTAAVLIAIGGATYARFWPGFDALARLTITAVALTLAGLVYQGLLFGFFFLPAIFPMSLLLSRPAILRVTCLALTVPLISVALLSVNGDNPRNAARRFVRGADNILASSQYSEVSARNIAGVAIVGPAYAFASIPELRGLSGTLRLLRHHDTILDGIQGGAAWGCAAAAIVIALILLVYRRELALLVAFGGMMLLPLIRMTQYGYTKYYVLLPFLVVLVLPRLGVRYVYPGLLGAVLLLSNVADIRTQIIESEDLRSRLANGLYSQVPATACFITNGWAPPVPDWRGPSLAWPHILQTGNYESEQLTSKANSLVLHDRLRNLFCTCPVVVTDAFLPSNLTVLQQELSSFRITAIPISDLLIRSPESAEIFQSRKFRLYRFSSEDQRQACEALR